GCVLSTSLRQYRVPLGLCCGTTFTRWARTHESPRRPHPRLPADCLRKRGMRLAAGGGEGNACATRESRLIDWVDHALDRWGQWAARTEAKAIGFPRYSPSCRADRSDGWGDGRLP